MFRTSLLFVSLLFSSFKSHAALSKNVKSASDRYTLFKDRLRLERDIESPKEHHHYFDLYLQGTSGLKGLIGEISGANSPSQSQTARTTSVNSVLARNMNSGHYLDLEVGAGVAISKFKLWNQIFYPSLRFVFDVGAAMGIYTPSTLPVLQLYLKNDVKLGPHFYMTHTDKFSSEIYFYQMTRSQIEISKDASLISTSNEDAVNLDELKLTAKSYRLDYSAQLRNGSTEYEIAMSELRVRETKDPGYKDVLTSRPLLRAMISRTYDSYYVWRVSSGIQARSRYSIGEGLFLATRVHKENYPFQFSTVLNSGYISLLPGFRWTNLRLSYGMKLPVNNGEEGLWVPNIHIFHLQASF